MNRPNRQIATNGVAARIADDQGADRIARLLHSAQVYGLAAVLMFGVLAFGAVENWSGFVMSAGAVALLMLWSAEQMARGRATVVLTPIFIPLIAFGGVIFVQFMANLSAYSYATKLTLITAIMLGILFWVATQSLRARDDLNRFTGVLAVFGFFVAAFAILQHFTSPNRIYWSILPPDAGLVFGPYVNRNHYAGCMELVLPLALAGAFSARRAQGQRVLFGFMAATMAASVFLSQSRAGSVCITLEAVLFGLILAAGRRRAVLGTLAAFLLLAAGLGLWLSGGHALERFGDVQDVRLRIASDSLHMVNQHPWLGWGAGTYEFVYPAFRSYTSRFVIDHAHNDYLEALAETGIIGLSMVVIFVVLLYRGAVLSLFKRTSSRTGPWMAALIGCTGLLMHSFVDFNMHIPANAALFLVLAAIAATTSEAKHNDLPRQIYWN
jgi:O-antigen ligase